MLEVVHPKNMLKINEAHRVYFIERVFYINNKLKTNVQQHKECYSYCKQVSLSHLLYPLSTSLLINISSKKIKLN